VSDGAQRYDWTSGNLEFTRSYVKERMAAREGSSGCIPQLLII